MMSAGEICERDVVTTTRQATTSEVARLMRERHVGCVVVVDSGNGGLSRPRGIVTDRDLVVEVTAVGLDPKVITAGDIMSRDVATVRADAPVVDAMQIMRAKGVRRLPVITHDGYLVGLVAFDDLLDVVSEQLTNLTRAVGREQAHETAARR